MEDGSLLGGFLRQARGERSRVSVTRAGGPEQALISRYESGDRFPTVESLKWLCDHYGADIREAVTLLERDRIARGLKRIGMAA